MGGRGGQLWRRITYRLPPPPCQPLATNDGSDQPAVLSSEPHLGALPASSAVGGTLEEEDRAGRKVTLRPSSFFAYLAGLMERNKMALSNDDAERLPFNFWGGLVGYLGYEIKAECGGRNAHPSPTPDASFFLSDQFLALDHLQGDVYLLALHNSEGDGEGQSSEAEATAWLAETASSLEGHRYGALGAGNEEDRHSAVPCGSCILTMAGAGARSSPPSNVAPPTAFRLCHSRDQYMANIETYRQALYDGESYEVCLSNSCLCRISLMARNSPHIGTLLSRYRSAPQRLSSAPGLRIPRSCTAC